jgi:type VI secretion system secreted protein VgrG
MKRMNLAVIILFLAGCSTAPSEDTIETAVVYTQAAQPTEIHTDVPQPDTPEPTQPPEPTDTPAPTNTTEPTIAPTSLP